MTKKSDKSVMTLQKLVIIIGLVSSLITATIGIGKEVVGVAKEWVVADNKLEVVALQEDISKLKVEVENMRNKLDSSILMSFPRKTREQTTSSHSQHLTDLKQGLNFGWIMGIIGIIGLSIFGIWHHFHNKKHINESK